MKNRAVIKMIILAAMALGMYAGAAAQTYPGYRTGNYTGVNGVFFNPANIADNRFKLDVNLIGINGYIGNDQASLGIKDITRSFSADSLKTKLLRGNQKVNSLVFADVLGPSIMVRITPLTSVAVSTRARVFSNTKDINGDLASAIIDGNNAAALTTKDILGNNAVIHAMGWNELGLSVGQIFTPGNVNHFFKGGITVKYLAGTADSYFSIGNINGTLGSESSAVFLAGPTTGHVSLNSTDADFKHYKASDFFKLNGSGIGFDVGFVYEYRPTADYSMYETDRFVNKYKVKFGLAVMDIGQIRYSKSSNVATGYTLNIPDGQRFPIGQFNNKSVKDFNGIFQDNPQFFTPDAVGSNSYKVSLPTNIQADLDYIIVGGLRSSFAVNLAAQIRAGGNSGFDLYYNNSYSLVPRYENPKFSLMVPLNYNPLTHFNAGVAVRLGPLYFGSGSVLSALFGNSKQADLHVGLHVGIPYKKKLKIDTDKDGIYDGADSCKYVAGLPRYNGCPIPDSDGDGVNDELDSCVHVPGLARYGGCPIPDTDHDGVNDEDDSCRDVPGEVRFQGCPDSDGDGIPDREDKCPFRSGEIANGGCPILDSDHDGVNDDVDACPNVPGPASSKGCPVEEVAIRLTAEFKNILFDFGKSTISRSSADIISNAAKIMNEQIPDESFYIDGYTDNVGTVARNKEVSRIRAKAVADALVAAGVAPSRVIARGFGKLHPKCDNATDEGRQCNRRVEVVIRKKRF